MRFPAAWTRAADIAKCRQESRGCRGRVARVFSFVYSSRHHVTLESEDLRIQRSDRNPETQIERALDELAQREVINTGVILSPDVRFYPVSLDRFITEILDQEFRPS